MIVKEHRHPDGKIVLAVCDSDLVGKKFEEGDKQLNLASSFYKGSEQEDLTVGDMMRNSDSVSIVGPKAIQLGLNEGIIEQESILTIAGIPYATTPLEKDI
ncbi:DUF424 family protein [Candidatus Woesearchaeota archaeon]|nr:DUF424 family protein [Candidatus Woesearchaeota archaeon]